MEGIRSRELSCHFAGQLLVHGVTAEMDLAQARRDRPSRGVLYTLAFGSVSDLEERFYEHSQ